MQHRDFYDPDYSGSYSIKKYESQKIYDDTGSWRHEVIRLEPLNHEYKPIVISEESVDEFRIVGEFIGVIKNSG